MQHFNVLVVGDKCTDKYIYGECKRLSPEQPIPVLDKTNIEEKPGMAANTEVNLQAFGVNTLLCSQREEIVEHLFEQASNFCSEETLQKQRIEE